MLLMLHLLLLLLLMLLYHLLLHVVLMELQEGCQQFRWQGSKDTVEFCTHALIVCSWES